MTTIKKNIAEYQALSEFERSIMEILAVASCGINQGQLVACFAAFGIKDKDGKSFEPKIKSQNFIRFRSELTKLMARDFLVGKNPSFLCPTKPYARSITLHLMREKRFSSMAEVIVETLELREEDFKASKKLKMKDLKAAMRIALLTEGGEAAEALYFRWIGDAEGKEALEAIWLEFCCHPFVPELFSFLPRKFQCEYIKKPVFLHNISWQKNSSLLDYAERLVEE
ncbi:hypothetical protein [Desulfobotulus mexicanus]|uniref:Uncharacterized protein n=1 Tax=Desulfobotulus mexicanus TaxID=2586642 RepID=A0A5Q4VC58_9BACT|nr:hypothetical protein [Desulfobotulus mexicanus]TYT75125.1 hypothetical protein FIM25_06960 [Desulfobotulus mexicanus]